MYMRRSHLHLLILFYSLIKDDSYTRLHIYVKLKLRRMFLKVCSNRFRNNLNFNKKRRKL